MAATTFVQPTKKEYPWLAVALVMFCAVIFGLVAAVLDSVLVLILFLPVIPVILVLRDYRAGVVFLTPLLPFANSSFLPKFPGFNIVGYLALATALSFAVNRLRCRSDGVRPPIWLFTLYVAPIVIGTVIGIPHLKEVPNYMVLTEAFAQDTPAKYIKGFLIYPMVTLVWAWMLATAMRGSKTPHRYVWVLFAGALLPALSQLVSVVYLGASGIGIDSLASSSTATSRSLLSISGFHANEMGILLASVFGPMLFVAAAGRRYWERVLLWLLLGIVSLALILTFSRGAYVAAAVSLMLFLFRSKSSNVSKLAIVVTLVVMIVALSGALLTRVSEGWSGSASSTSRADAVTASRSIIWSALWPEVIQHPVVGNGLRSTAWSGAARSGVFPTHPHNLYLEILLDMGFAGLIMMLWFFGRFAAYLKAASRCQNSPLISAYLSGALASLVGYLISAVANGHYIAAPENTFLWASFGVAMAINASLKTPNGQAGTFPAGLQRTNRLSLKPTSTAALETSSVAKQSARG